MCVEFNVGNVLDFQNLQFTRDGDVGSFFFSVLALAERAIRNHNYGPKDPFLSFSLSLSLSEPLFQFSFPSISLNQPTNKKLIKTMEDTPRTRKRIAQKLVLSSSSSKDKKRAKFKDNENDIDDDDDHPQILPILDTSSSNSSDSSSSDDDDDDDDTLSLESEIISISDSESDVNDDDDDSVPSRAAYKLKRPKIPINVGDLVYARTLLQMFLLGIFLFV